MALKIIFQKHIILIGFLVAVTLLCIAAMHYPGGSNPNINSAGYSFTDNYISNLLEYKAVNGMENGARPYGVLGIMILGITSGFGFVRLSQKVKNIHFSNTIKYLGIILMVLSLLITIPSLHDLVVTLSSIPTPLLIFYITMLLLKTKLTGLKITSIVLLILFYVAIYMYFAKSGIAYLPSVQKAIHIIEILWILCLDYCTKNDDFDHI